ncbi:MAG: amino acid-binding protein [Oscillospiraceae bacterium]|nr:amino acid-binding protein [Oscillospiraceae bacterium]MBR5723565.1 amino acid-binding protein [Oscillospiraceae bacterium]
METIKQFSIFVENKQGKMAELTRLIADAGIDLRTLSLADTRDFGILRIIVNKPAETEALLRENGWTFKITSVIGVKVPDCPGGVATVLEALNEANVNVEYMYAFVNRTPGRADTVICVDDEEAAFSILRSKNIDLLTEAEAYDI